MPLILDLPPPAIIKSVLPSMAHVGLSHSLIDGVVRVEYEWLSFPKDIREASEEEFRAYLPRELRELPRWMMTKGILFFVPYIVNATPLVKTTVNISTTSVSNQTYSPVLTDWNVADNTIECGSHSGDGGNDADSNCGAPPTHFQGGGGGGGGRALKNNVPLTPAGSMTFHNEAHGTGTSTATWANGATLAASSAGINGAGNGGDAVGDATDGCCGCGGGSSGGAGSGASTVGAKGDIKTAGSNAVGATGGAGGGGIAPAGGNNQTTGSDGAIRLVNNVSLP